MTDLQTLDALHASLDTHPDDWATRLVLADLLTDLGRDDEAACQRWMAGHLRAPTTLVPIPSIGRRWYWYHHLHAFAADCCPQATLPETLWSGMGTRPSWWGGWNTRGEAEATLFAALRAAGEI